MKPEIIWIKRVLFSRFIQVLVFLALAAVALASPAAEKPKEEIPAVETKAEETKVDDTKKDKRGLFDLGLPYAAAPAVFTSGVNTHTNTIITKEVPVPVAHPVPVAVEKHVPYPVIQKVCTWASKGKSFFKVSRLEWWSHAYEGCHSRVLDVNSTPRV